ncbi:MAG: hypothetical protein JSW52_05775 [Candidatus Coatesbacteria bacterium]|nr:MAG: hypothetical protein JSW52_05775 [Candidatus Coatesbacteria bacterium]
MANGEKPLEPKWLFYIISFIIPIAGLIIGIIYLTKDDPECKAFGRNCIIAAVLFVIACCVCFMLYFLGVFGCVGCGMLSTAGSY